MYRRTRLATDRAPPTGDWSDCSRVAKAAIEKNVDEHKLLIAKRKGQLLDHVPSLVDLAAERLGKLSTSFDDVPAVIFESYIYNIPYAAFRRGLLGLSADPGAPISAGAGDIDQWVLLNEKWLRDGHHAKWQHGLVTLSEADNVFPNSILNPSSRMITRPEGPLPGHELLCGGRESRITIQPSVEAFKRAFDHMSDGLLKNLDWSNVLVAGGIVLRVGTLLSVDIEGQPRRDPRWDSSDMDVYIYGLSPKKANDKIEHLFQMFRANLPPGTKTLVVRNWFYAKYPLRRIQIVLKLVESPKTVLLNFDPDICAMGWDGTTLWMLPRASRALEMGCNVFTMSLIRGHYLSDRRATAGEQRDWTTKQVGNVKCVVSVQTVLPQDVRYRASRALNEFRVFMRCPGEGYLGEYRVRTACCGSLPSFLAFSHKALDDRLWFRPTSTMILRYKWDTGFNFWSFEKHIRSSNATEICNWQASDIFGRLDPYSDFCEELEFNQSRYRRIVSTPTVDALLSRKNDLMLQVFLPPKFADYASNLVRQAQVQAGLPQTQLLIPIERDSDTEVTRKEGLFFWRIGKDLMWQQIDRHIDECPTL
ncbi:hypothetical protein C8R45DRAFT_1167129 [Mycena sanguinolenta]|nr:hypothetical protein C8R45DRAFT_1167129 [Mycena sanguinolenta]